MTFECDEPPAARVDKTVVVSGRGTRGMSPGGIDDHAKARIGAGADLYRVDGVEAIAAILHPQCVPEPDPRIIQRVA